jgi:hypothetical protein
LIQEQEEVVAREEVGQVVLLLHSLHLPLERQLRVAVVAVALTPVVWALLAALA